MIFCYKFSMVVNSLSILLFIKLHTKAENPIIFKWMPV